MLECLVLGDSIGVGISQVKKECHAIVQSGINSKNYVDRFGPVNRYNKHTIISLGTNDTDAVNTYMSLLKLRLGLKTPCVTWILPSKTLKPKQHEAVLKIATKYKDFVIEPTKKQLSKDKIHPNYSGYKSLSSSIENNTCF